MYINHLYNRFIDKIISIKTLIKLYSYIKTNKVAYIKDIVCFKYSSFFKHSLDIGQVTDLLLDNRLFTSKCTQKVCVLCAYLCW